MSKKQRVDDFCNDLKAMKLEFKRFTDFHIQVLGHHNIYPSSGTYHNDETGEKFIFIAHGIHPSAISLMDSDGDILDILFEDKITLPYNEKSIEEGVEDIKKNILEEANDIVYKRSQEKSREYGDFSESMSKAAVVASEMCNKKITTEDFFKCMIALKISRMAYNHKEDTMMDAASYIAGLNEYLKNK